jgi:hypothetical protein
MALFEMKGLMEVNGIDITLNNKTTSVYKVSTYQVAPYVALLPAAALRSSW